MKQPDNPSTASGTVAWFPAPGPHWKGFPLKNKVHGWVGTQQAEVSQVLVVK